MGNEQRNPHKRIDFKISFLRADWLPTEYNRVNAGAKLPAIIPKNDRTNIPNVVAIDNKPIEVELTYRLANSNSQPRVRILDILLIIFHIPDAAIFSNAFNLQNFCRIFKYGVSR